MSRARSRILRSALAAALCTTAAVTGPAAVPGAAVPAASAVPSAASAPAAHALCADPAPGRFACLSVRRTASPVVPHASTSSTPHGYRPHDLQTAYRLPSTTAGAGQRVYIVDAYDAPAAEHDLGVYRHTFGLPACTTANGCFRKIDQRGGKKYPRYDRGWAGEISLDLDMVSAICPRCGITLVEADSASDNLFVAVQRAVSLGARFVSMSWGGPEFSDEHHYDRYFTAPGTVFTASTGDAGYGTLYPAASPNVVAVGGTALYRTSTGRHWSERAWYDYRGVEHGAGAGSGCSRYEAKPTYQRAVPTSVCAHRAEADVSAVADPATGVAVYESTDHSYWSMAGGTSASAPIIAAVYALAGRPARTAPQAGLYAHRTSLYDVTVGYNKPGCTHGALCSSRAGWDGPTGLGTPNGVTAFRPAS